MMHGYGSVICIRSRGERVTTRTYISRRASLTGRGKARNLVLGYTAWKCITFNSGVHAVVIGVDDAARLPYSVNSLIYIEGAELLPVTNTAQKRIFRGRNNWQGQMVQQWSSGTLPASPAPGNSDSITDEGTSHKNGDAESECMSPTPSTHAMNRSYTPGDDNVKRCDVGPSPSGIAKTLRSPFGN